jgi:hypothetical protein
MWFPRNITPDEKQILIWLWDELERSRLQRVLSWRLRQSSHTPSLDRRVYLDDITRNRILGTAVNPLKALPLRSENRPVFHGGYP